MEPSLLCSHRDVIYVERARLGDVMRPWKATPKRSILEETAQ